MDAPEFDRAISTRNICICGLVATWLVSLFCIGFASYSIHIGENWGHRLYQLPHLASELLPLIFNLVVTLCADCLGYIHGTSLRWALWRENRLAFNSNLRLFTGARKSVSNSAIVNAISACWLILTYTGSSQTFLYTGGSNFGDYRNAGSDFRVSINNIAVAALGIGLCGQACISTWSLWSAEIPTWSSNPLNTTLACLRLGLTPRLRRCMLSTTAKDEDGAKTPCRSQTAAWEANPTVKWPTWLMWILIGLCIGWASIVVGLTIQSYGKFQASFPLGPLSGGNIGFAIAGPTWSVDTQTLVSLLLIAVIQSGLTLGLHCMELIVNISRDEDAWRLASRWMFSEKTSKQTGAQIKYSSIKSALTSWQTVGLLLFKALTHWFFGLGITLLGVNGYDTASFTVTMRALPLYALAACGIVLAVFGTWIVCRKPKGPQPSAWGHLQTLADLVDDWDTSSTMMYWGDKGLNKNGTRHAGTSSLRSNVGRIHFNELYE